MTADAPAPRLNETRRLRVEIQGAVQGVGFRPFVYRLATELGLNGWVLNDTAGVFIEVEGAETGLRAFEERVRAEKPPLALIQGVATEWLDPAGYDSFEIRHSDGSGAKTVLVLPDVATCADCRAEVMDPGDRRYGYPFTNCTNCGPRFSIIQALPYDRPNTTMRQFALCPACQAEYDDPANRRFHAQPNACPVCGPGVEWVGSGQWTVAGGQWLAAAGEALRQGLVVAVKGLGGFHLMADARNGEAVGHLRERKARGEKPFAVMVRDLDQAREIVHLTAAAEALLSAPEAPIVLLPRRDGATIAAEVAPNNPTLGVILAYTPLHHLLLKEVGFPVVATSGNLSDEPICIDEEEAMVRLASLADAFLIHNRPIERHVDDSIAWIVEGEPRLLRRARGYAPLPMISGQWSVVGEEGTENGGRKKVGATDGHPPLLAVGAHLKNTVALRVGERVFVSQHIGDLETAEAMAAFERVIADFVRLYEAPPAVIAHDMHPDYVSTQWAKNVQASKHWAVETLGVQHHHAHLAACLEENGMQGPALGVIWDGTGYGSDGTIWGGEFLLGDAGGFERVAHLRPFRLPGGDAAVHESRRAALALLWELMGEACLDRDDLAPIRALASGERRLLGQMLAKGVNAPVTTSAGRLFDGLASLLGLRQTVSYEGEAAMAMEYAADTAVQDAYPMNVSGQAAPGMGVRTLVVDWGPMVEALLADAAAGAPASTAAARCHNGFVEAIVAVAQEVGHPRVALSGGCFQNRLLVERLAPRLRQAGFEVILHRLVPPNDGGISLGQIAVALASVRAKPGAGPNRA